MNGSSRRRIGIVGAGTGGLAAAAFLARDGHEVTLFERFVRPRPVGAGLLLQPTGLACLELLGLKQAALDHGAPIRALLGRTVAGRSIFDIHYGDFRPDWHGLGMRRGTLFALLYDAVQDLGVPIVTACEIADAPRHGAGRTVSDRHGTQHGPFDLVIDASGVQSPLRARYGQTRLDRTYPYGAVWGLCSVEGTTFDNDVLAQRYDGAHTMIGVMPVGRDPQDRRQSTFFWSMRADRLAAWADTDMAAWRKTVAGLWPELAPVLEQFTDAAQLNPARYSDVVMKTWHAPALLFIGDAAHCTSPQLGQGANMALLDAATIATCLSGCDTVEAALTAYQRRRRAHIRFYQTASRWLTPFFQSDSWSAALIRDWSFHTMCHMPFIKGQMLRTLSGLKTGWLTAMDPRRLPFET